MSSIWDKVSEGFKSVIQQGASSDGKASSLSDRIGLKAMSDEALRNELERRRRGRGRAAHGRNAADDELTAMSSARRDRVRERSLAKCFALLELPVGSSRIEVQRAYRALLRQYHPDRYLGEGDQHASSVALVTSLTDAYLSLIASFDRR